MLYKTACFLFVLYDFIVCTYSYRHILKTVSPSQTLTELLTESSTQLPYGRSLPFHQSHPHGVQSSIHQATTFSSINLYTDTNELFFNDNRRTRHQRGIVLIDEDFDKLPDVGVRQGWSDGNPELTERAIVDKVSEKGSFTEEGSGDTSILIEETTSKLITPSELQMTKEQLRPQEKTLDPNTAIEGSGEDIPTPAPTSLVKEWDLTNHSFLATCLNTTCDSKHVRIQPGFAETIAEDESLILSCTVDNFTGNELLRWYKNNGSEGFLLETSASSNQLHFAIPDAKEVDSGTYVCVRITEKSCCYKQMEVTIYKKPNYKYHLLIIGLVAGVSLFTCLLLGIHRRYKIKQYKKEIKTQIPLNEFLL